MPTALPVSTPTDFANFAQTKLAATVNQGFTGVFKFEAMKDPLDPSSTVAWPVTGPQLLTIFGFDQGQAISELLYFTGMTVNADNTFESTGTVYRNVQYASGAMEQIDNIGRKWLAGSTVLIGFASQHAANIPNLAGANTFSGDLNLASGVKIVLNNGAEIRENGTDMEFESPDAGSVDLSTLKAAAGVDEKFLVSSNDTTAGFLNGKMVIGDGIEFTENNDGANETLTISVNVKAGSGLSFDTGELTVDSGIWQAGDLKHTAVATAPAGWLVCDGSDVSRTVYADLFAAIGTAYGAGDGTTTFNLPDLRGRVLAGLDDMGTGSANVVTDVQADNLGGLFGSETHTLSASELAPHAHTVSVGGAGGGGGGISTGTSNSSTVNTSAAGSGAPHNNMQPTAFVYTIIKT